MKLNRLETHDRLKYFVKDQSLNVAKGAEECLTQNALSVYLQQYSPYIYLYAHPRTHDDGVTKVMYWQPRLSKPASSTNSYLFRAASNTDICEVCWLLPPKETWAQFLKGKVTEENMVMWSINQFCYNKAGLDRAHPEDMDDEICKKIYEKVYSEMKFDDKSEKFKKLQYDEQIKPLTSEES
jgi:hypothetical protein